MVEGNDGIDQIEKRPKPFQGEKAFERDEIKQAKDESEEDFRKRGEDKEREARETAKTLRVEKHINPLGEGREINRLAVAIGGDYHIPIAEPENIGAAARAGPQRIITQLSDKLDERDPKKGKGWWKTGLQERFFEAFLTRTQAIKSIVVEEARNESAFLLIDTGDSAMPSGGKLDVEYTAQVMAGIKREVLEEAESGSKEQRAAFFLSGDHDIESQDHGVNLLEERDRRFGPQYFSQEIGGDEDGILVVALETPFFDPKEEKNFEQLRGTERGDKAWEIFQQYKKEQIELLQDAADKAQKGRRVVLMGHELGVMKRFVRRPDQKYDEETAEGILPNVVQIVTGHYHTEKVQTPIGRKTIGLVSGYPIRTIRNNQGEEVQVSIPQAATYGLAGRQFLEEPSVIRLSLEQGKPIEVQKMKVEPEKIRELL